MSEGMNVCLSIYIYIYIIFGVFQKIWMMNTATVT